MYSEPILEVVGNTSGTIMGTDAAPVFVDSPSDPLCLLGGSAIGDSWGFGTCAGEVW